MYSYKPFTLEERQLIEDLLKQGFSQAKIARKIGRPQSTLSYELRMGGGYKSYNAEKANSNRTTQFYRPALDLLEKRLSIMESHLEIILETLEKLNVRN